MKSCLHGQTPTLSIIDSRRLAVRRVAFHRVLADDVPTPRIIRRDYDLAGRLNAEWDARLWARMEKGETLKPNLLTLYSLSGHPLLTESVDAGWRLALPGGAGQTLIERDGRGLERLIEYDALLRPVSITEQDQVVERLTYGSADGAGNNSCNQLVRHDDTAGSRYLPEYGLSGSALLETRHFLLDPASPDWPIEVAERTAWLEVGGLTTERAFNALDEPIRQTDAMGNTQRFAHTAAGQLKETCVQLADADAHITLVSDIHYNAFDQVDSETAGNGVLSHSLYDPHDGRLIELSAALGNAQPLQHLKYSYDPVGNIVQIEDATQPVRYFANQRIEPINQYHYDTLYQLIEATGREVKTGTCQGPALPDLQKLPPDPNQMANYTETFDYDAGGNVLKMRHVGAQSFTRMMRVAADSDRSLLDGQGAVDFEKSFDANGNLQQLVRDQDLSWDVRNQLRQITTVQRDSEPNDEETFIYDGNGQRCRKISSTHTSGRTLINEVRYLPNLEIRTSANGDILHVITAQAGRNSVRVLHWQAGKPSDISNDQLRYSLSDHLGSSTLELDEQAGLISQETYYPYGGTAWWAARSALDAKYKTVRYSGKERDATGLYYYGFRYYAPWLMHWINPDPAGVINGLNIYCFVANTPTCYKDTDGRLYEGGNDDIERVFERSGGPITHRGLAEFTAPQRHSIRSALFEAQTMHEDALTMISQFPEHSAPVLRSYFGAHHENTDIQNTIINTWTRTRDLLHDYQGHWGQAKFIGLSQHRGLASIIPGDFHGRISLNIESLDEPDLPVTLSHEASHLGRVNRIRTVGPATQDYWYLFRSGLPSLLPGRTLPYEDPYQNVSEIIVGGGLNTDYFSRFPEIEHNFISRVRDHHSGPEPIQNLSDSIAVFNRNSNIATAMAVENADSLALAANNLHRIYRGVPPSSL
ncbi:MAG TPA: RHS repeat-associated core domain-containing protein [Pseudomonas sp.]|uniref:RHS repeat domain-containing protein n=1 Tax=Pseudomonas sp. TaxID=306 RepID=UPI002EDA2F2C